MPTGALPHQRGGARPTEDEHGSFRVLAHNNAVAVGSTGELAAFGYSA